MFLLWLRQLAWCRDQTLASVPPCTEGRSIPTETPVFPVVPSSYQVLCGSIYSFPLVTYSCPLSAGVLHILLCLMVYSWCFHGERCTSNPPIPPPSFIYNSYFHTYISELWFLIIYCSYVWPEENDWYSLGVLQRWNISLFRLSKMGSLMHLFPLMKVSNCCMYLIIRFIEVLRWKTQWCSTEYFPHPKDAFHCLKRQMPVFW